MTPGFIHAWTRHSPGFVLGFFLMIGLTSAAPMAWASHGVSPVDRADPMPRRLSSAELLKATQNPVADLANVPMEFTNDTGIGRHDRASQSISLQPVIPVPLSPDWMLVSRTFVPLHWQARADQPSGLDVGLGDIGPSLFLVPKKSDKLIWGVGASTFLPTASNRALGSGKFSIGPTAVVLIQPGDWTLGAVAGHVWSVAGPGDRASVSRTSLEYFVIRNLADNWYVNTSPTIVADWNAPAKDRWLIPVGAGIGRLVNVGNTPVDISAGLYRNVSRPEGAPDWRFSFQVMWMLAN